MITVIIGKARAGKTTFARALAKALKVESACTSDIVYEVVALSRGCTVEELKQLPKEELRPCLINIGDYLCDIEPDFLSSALVERGYRIIDGVRRGSELDALDERYSKVHVILIERPDNTVEDNFSINPDAADEVVYNDGTIEDLEEKAKNMSRHYTLGLFLLDVE